jgi:hypothetical protein
MIRYVIGRLSYFFLGGASLILSLGIAYDYDWGMTLVGAALVGLYVPLSTVSIAVWRAAQGKDPEEMTGVFGIKAVEIVPRLYNLYQRNRGIVVGVTILTWLSSGSLIALWLEAVHPGAWEYTPGLLLFLTGGISLCGALAGPGLAVVALLLVENNSTRANEVDER